jgi:NADPH-dependent ferric siderophore reductase
MQKTRVLRLYTIYRRPAGFVAVEFEVHGTEGGGAVCGPQVAKGRTLGQVRQALHQFAPAADTCLQRHSSDARDIVETWV